MQGALLLSGRQVPQLPSRSAVKNTGRLQQHLVRAIQHNGCEEGFDPLRYRRNVGVCVVDRNGLVFCAQRSDSSCNTWQMPQGGIDDGENLEAAALRELQEETSMTSATVLATHPRWLIYHFPTEVRAKLHGGWDRYEGQAQKWVLVLFHGELDEINLNTEHQEFKAWAFMPLAQLPDLVVEFKRDVYQQVAAEFVPIIERLRQSGELKQLAAISASRQSTNHDGVLATSIAGLTQG